jgi:hypothetical protein
LKTFDQTAFTGLHVCAVLVEVRGTLIHDIGNSNHRSRNLEGHIIEEVSTASRKLSSVAVGTQAFEELKIGGRDVATIFLDLSLAGIGYGLG